MELLNQALDPGLSVWKFSNWKLLILIWNRQKVPDGILEVEPLHVLLSLLSVFSSLASLPPLRDWTWHCLEEAWSMHLLLTCLLVWFRGLTSAPQLREHVREAWSFPWEKLFVLLITNWSLKPNKMKCCIVFFFSPSLTKRWVPWDRVRSVVRERAGLHVAEHQLPVYNQGTLSESGIFTALKGVKAWFQFCSATCRLVTLAWTRASASSYGK